MEEKKSLQHFLIKNFIIILLMVSGFESILVMLLDRFVGPLFQNYFHLELGGKDMMQIICYMLLVLLLQVVKSIFPKSIQMEVIWFMERIGSDRDIQQDGLWNLSRLQGILLFLLVFTVIVVIIIPFVFAAVFYARIVIREVQHIQKQREAAKKKFDRQRNLMLSDIAHDLRTPITTIFGYARALNDGMVTDSEKRREYLSAIQDKSSRMSELINLLFDYVKLDSEGFSLNKKEINLSELLRSCGAMLFSDIEERGMELEVDIPEEACIISADEI